MRGLASVLRAVLLAIPLGTGAAHAQLFGATGLDAKFCEQPAVRQTVVYVDDMMMTEGRTDWALKLSDKLRATLAPGERVTVVRLAPADGQSGELWSGCWPAYSEQALAEIRRQTYLFSRNPEASLGDQQKYFLQGFGGALTKIYLDARRPAGDVRFSATHPRDKQILRALASDEGRFSNSRVTIRAIVYSDLAEHSDLGSVYQPSPDPPDIGQKLGSYLRRGVFYDYGVGEGVTDDPGFAETARAFWNAALRSMAATVAGIGADLNVANTIPLQAHDFPVVLDFREQPLDGRLSLLTDADGNLIDSWIGISRLRSAAITGTFLCKGAGTDAACRLNGTTLGGVASTSPSESLAMTGSIKAGLKGRLGVKGTAALFDIRTSPAE